MRTLRMIGLLGLLLVGSTAPAQKTGSATTLKAGLKAGLKGEYFSGPNFEQKVMTRTDAQVDFDWNWQSPGPGVPREYFSVRWTGKLYAPTPGKYRFSATADDGVRVWVNGQKVIDEWRKQDDSRFVGEVALNGRQLYDLRIEYYNDWKGSIIAVSWELPEEKRFFGFGSTTMPRQVIPAQYLFSGPIKLTPAEIAVRTTLVRTPVVPVASGRPVTKSGAPKSASIKPATASAKKQEAPLAAVSAKPIRQPRPAEATVVPGVAATAASPPVVQSFENLKMGEAIVLRHVVFAQSEHTLLPESYAELNKLVRALQADTQLRVEIAGHTDNVGDKRLNQALSEFRAKVVANYLIRHGIADTRITAKGYGGSRPIADNTREEQRAQNRRVEFIVNQ